MKRKVSKAHLERLYKKYNRREFVRPDPLELLYHYKNPRDIEIAGLIASSLAYGRVQQILKSVASVLKKMTPTPYTFLVKAPEKKILKTFSDFKHRFTTAHDLAKLLIGVKKTIGQFDSLKNCFTSALPDNQPTIIPALTNFVSTITKHAGEKTLQLLPPPEKGSACKRLNLFLRWMIRKDGVDLGIWDNISPSKLIIPLDVHMHRISRKLGITKRRQANLKTALDISSVFAKLSPKDPAKYDFVLTRFGIHPAIKKINLF